MRKDLESTVVRADEVARRVTGLGDQLGSPRVRVVGRRAWMRDNLASLAWLTDPVADQLVRRSGVGREVAKRALAIQLGVVFGYLSTRVLGQYEVFLPGDEEPGRLTLVGPNLVRLEREYLPTTDVSTAEFRMGIALHESAHRLQFEGVEWLRPTLRRTLDEYLADARIDPERVRETIDRAGELLRNPQRLLDAKELLEVVLTPAQRTLLERAQNIVTLLEGHGNVVMDWGAEVIVDEDGLDLDPSRVRQVLNRRRQRPADQVLRKALGLSMKAEQYRVGERFIFAVEQAHGRAAFNRVWDDPAHMPTAAELDDPDGWMARVAGRAG
jgi:coenzyme F420 biosynthesis associated uncharacterized protein